MKIKVDGDREYINAYHIELKQENNVDDESGSNKNIVESTKIKEMIVIDFDGPIHKYSKGYQGDLIYDSPTEGIEEKLKELNELYDLTILTARYEPDTIIRWLDIHNIKKYFKYLTNIKPPAAKYIDDNGIKFTNWDSVAKQIKSQVKAPTEIKLIDKTAKKSVFSSLYNRNRLPKNFTYIFIDKTHKKNLFGILKSVAGQINMFSSKEGETKPGKGGTLQLKRSQDGKTNRWQLLNKKKVNSNSQTPEAGQTGSKLLSTSKAYDYLAEKLGNKAVVTTKTGEELGTGMFQLINENSDKSLSLFFKDSEGINNIINIPTNKAVMLKNNNIIFPFADKDINISLTEAADDMENPVKVVEEENSDPERMKEWDQMADSYIKIAKAQQDRFLMDIDDIARDNNLDPMGYKYKNQSIIPKEKLINKFQKNERDGNFEDNLNINGVLSGLIVVKSPNATGKIKKGLEDKGYVIEKDLTKDLYDDETPGYKQISLFVSLGENDDSIKELKLITPEMYKAKYIYGTEIEEIKDNVYENLGKRIHKDHNLYPHYQSFLKNIERITNDFYKKAYELDVNSSSKSKDASSSPARENSSSKDNNFSVSISTPPKRLMRELRSSLKAISQPLLAAASNDSGSVFNFSASGVSTSNNLFSILNPSKNVKENLQKTELN